MKSDDAETISVHDAKKMLGIGINQTYEAIRCGEIPAIRIGGKWLVLRKPLERMLGRALAMKPAGWFVKDFADGWIFFDNEIDAIMEAQDTGQMILTAYQEIKP